MVNSIDFNLYLITDRKLFPSRDLLFTAVEEALKAGVRAIQLREKDATTKELLAMSYGMRELTEKYGAMLFINDRVDVALCVKADGVHLGRSGIPVYAVRDIFGDRLKIGVSTHNLEEALTAERKGADFITFGPLYHTPSKSSYGEPVGLASLKMIRGKVRLPIFGIGGIKPERVKEVKDAGAYGVALISGILGERDIRKATEKYLKAL